MQILEMIQINGKTHNVTILFDLYYSIVPLKNKEIETTPHSIP